MKKNIIAQTSAILLLLIVYIHRFFTTGNLIVNYRPYYDLVVSKSGGSYFFDLYHSIIRFILQNNIYLLVSMSFLIALVSVITFKKILLHYRFSPNLVLISLLIFIFSPKFISTYSISIRDGFSLCFFLV